jgi:ATP-binding cassette subfamily C protein
MTIMPCNVTLALGLMMVSLGLTDGVSLLMLMPPLQLVGLHVQQGALDGIANFVTSLLVMINISILGVYVLVAVLHSLLKRWETSLSASLSSMTSILSKKGRTISGSAFVFFN